MVKRSTRTKADNPQGSSNVLHIDATFAGQTLSSLLRSIHVPMSWEAARKKVAGRFIQINGNLCLDPARRLIDGDVVKIWDSPRSKVVESSDIQILYADEFLFVLDKPAGVTSVRHHRESGLSKTRRQLQPTLDELASDALHNYLLVQERNFAKMSGTKPKRTQRDPKVYPVHRLDRDTSGLMLMARTPAARDALTKMFKNHKIDRRYLAIVAGQPSAQTFSSFIARDRGDGLRGSVDPKSKPEAQSAVTHIRSLESIGPYTFIECRLETGRTHQIRIHLSEAGYPLLGEATYTRLPDGSLFVDQSSAPRQVLHSHALRFTHPFDDRVLTFKASWPNDLKQWLAKLQASFA